MSRPQLRASQVETLRVVGEMSERSARASSLWIAERLGISDPAAYRRCALLETRRYLASDFVHGRCWYRLTQLGKEALASSGKGAG